MGQSFDVASKKKSSAKFNTHTAVYDKDLDFYYHPFWDGDSLKIEEYRLQRKDTIYKRIEKVDYIIGSGQHTNSHILNTNGFLTQMPMTFYTQKKTWDLPPGFENGFNTRFSRKIGLECMSCHNALPTFVKGSENQYTEIPTGINCERCHGPGSIHVALKQEGVVVDTSKYIDYSIVNPAKLSVDRQFDVCQRCHLQGNAVLKNEKSFFDFKPGMTLSDIMTVFLPKYEGADDEFIMASHSDRLKQSQCFIKSFKTEKTNSLKPYKESLTCVTCHNPHVSVKVTGKEIFNNACKNCHGSKTEIICTEQQDIRNKKQNNCISCHMPKSGSIDIPHVSITDHFIRKPISKNETEKVKKFIGLVAINESNPTNYVKAQAYINQFEKFDSNNYSLLDSAQKLLKDNTLENVVKNLPDLIRINFFKNDFKKIINYTTQVSKKQIFSQFNKTSCDNRDAWVFYHIGESYYQTVNMQEAHDYFKRADELSPHNAEFKNKLAATLMALNKIPDAEKIYYDIITKNPKYAPSYCNLGYIFVLKNELKIAMNYYDKALTLDPDYEQALINKTGLLMALDQKIMAKTFCKNLLKKYPTNQQGLKMWEVLK